MTDNEQNGDNPSPRKPVDAKITYSKISPSQPADDELSREVGKAFAESMVSAFQTAVEFPFINRTSLQPNTENVLTYDAVVTMLDSLPNRPKEMLYFINIDDALALFRLLRKSGFGIVRQRNTDGVKLSIFSVMDNGRATGEIAIDRLRALERGKVVGVPKPSFTLSGIRRETSMFKRFDTDENPAVFRRRFFR